MFMVSFKKFAHKGFLNFIFIILFAKEIQFRSNSVVKHIHVKYVK